MVPPPPPPGDPEPDPVTAALAKIASHIGSAHKFAKAAGLLRQLLGSGTLAQDHGPAVFAALRAAMAVPSRADQPELRREYLKLFTAASKAKHLFSQPELTELDVYGIWAVLRAQLATDDSFQFNRVVGHVKQAIAALPEASADDDAIMTALQARLQGDADVPAKSSGQENAATGEQEAAADGNHPAAADAPMAQAAQPAAEAEGASAAVADAQPAADGEGAAAMGAAKPAEADPFGLDAVLDQERAQRKARQDAAAWRPEEAVCMRRAALLDCFDGMIAACSNAWAQLSTEIAIEELVKHRGNFGPSQQERITELHQFAKQQRITRQRGPSAADKRRDTTTFEAARKTWSTKTVSARGTIMTGDHKSETWLG